MQRMMLLYRSSVWKGRRRCCFQAVVIDGVRHGTCQGARLVIGSCSSVGGLVFDPYAKRAFCTAKAKTKLTLQRGG